MPRKKEIIINEGDKFGVLEFIKETRKSNCGQRYCLCKCICGSEIEVNLYELKNKNFEKCTCSRKQRKRAKIAYIIKDGIEHKKCTICLEFKELKFFNKRKGSIDGLRHDCKKCKSKRAADKMRIRRKIDENYAQKERLKSKIFSQSDAGKKYRKEYLTKVSKTIQYKLIATTRSRIRFAIKNFLKYKKSLDLLGCDISEYRKYLESKFKAGMTWENYDRGKNEVSWEIDHIIPCASFDLSVPEEQVKCFHYTNTQPLWDYENLRKSAKLDWQGENDAIVGYLSSDPEEHPNR